MVFLLQVTEDPTGPLAPLHLKIRSLWPLPRWPPWKVSMQEMWQP